MSTQHSGPRTSLDNILLFKSARSFKIFQINLNLNILITEKIQSECTKPWLYMTVCQKMAKIKLTTGTKISTIFLTFILHIVGTNCGRQIKNSLDLVEMKYFFSSAILESFPTFARRKP